jgi:hypothetical protein
MRILITIIMVTALGAVLGHVLPFWSLALAGVLVGAVVRPGGWRALVGGMLGGALLWGGLAAWADAANMGVLSARIADLFGASVGTMKGITAAIGAVLGGLGSLLGDRSRGPRSR